jgi:hypothetical protein
MSKGYTINFFINTLTGATNTQIDNYGVFNVVSPRYGAGSVKAEALNTLLDGSVCDIAAGAGKFAKLGKTSRTRLLKALRIRKKFGYLAV